jgi:fructose/tagatose bisphosphate aldolase
VEEIQEGIKHGVHKVNIDTDIRLAMTGAMRKLMAEKPDEFDPRDPCPDRAHWRPLCEQPPRRSR